MPLGVPNSMGEADTVAVVGLEEIGRPVLELPYVRYPFTFKRLAKRSARAQVTFGSPRKLPRKSSPCLWIRIFEATSNARLPKRSSNFYR